MTLYTRQIGDGSIPVVFVHGLFGQSKNFTQIARCLSDVASSLLVDLPNHGHSVRTDRFDYGLFASMLAETVNAWINQPVVLIGHSMGGKTVMRTVLDYPEIADAIAVLDMAPVRYEDHSFFDTIVSALRALDLRMITTRAEADHALREQIPDATIRAFLLQSLQRDPDATSGWRWLLNLDLLSESMATMADWQPGRTPSWDRPVQWIVGANSHLRPLEAKAQMRRLFPKTHLVTLARCGHWVHSEQPDLTCQALRYFLTHADISPKQRS